MKRRVLMLACSGAALASSGAYAEEAGDGAEADANSVAEIIVTAQRKEERLQDVPVAVTAVGRAMLEKLWVSNFTNLSGLAPNVQINGAGQQSSQTTVARRKNRWDYLSRR